MKAWGWTLAFHKPDVQAQACNLTLRGGDRTIRNWGSSWATYLRPTWDTWNTLKNNNKLMYKLNIKNLSKKISKITWNQVCALYLISLPFVHSSFHLYYLGVKSSLYLPKRIGGCLLRDKLRGYRTLTLLPAHTYELWKGMAQVTLYAPVTTGIQRTPGALSSSLKLCLLYHVIDITVLLPLWRVWEPRNPHGVDFLFWQVTWLGF